MAPKKKAQKISLNEFLGDSGSWADEMDSLPSAPAVRSDEERARGNDRLGRRGEDFLSSRPDRGVGPLREDLPLPTQPPYTAFIGNLAFDLTEIDLEEFFAGHKTKAVKIIKDRDEKPKGFGYVEFEELEGLKDALAKTGANLSNRTIRVSVAEPPKERGGFGGGFDDDTKFDSPWRRDGPLPDLPNSREASRRRFDGPSSERVPSGVAEGADQWRSSRSSRLAPPEPELPITKRKSSGFSTPEGHIGPADTDEKWTKGSKFTPSTSEDNAGSRFGGFKGRSDMGPPKEPPPSIADENDWRSNSRPKPTPRGSTSPSSSTPPTPQLTRRKLELIPRSNSNSASPSPLSSPKMSSTSALMSSRSNPFGNARPVDVSSREREVAERLEKDREITKDRLASHSMSRTSSRTASLRTRTPPPATSITNTPPTPNSPKLPSLLTSATVRPAVSFASAASAKKETPATAQKDGDDDQM
jgi:translation initiation factor 4B